MPVHDTDPLSGESSATRIMAPISAQSEKEGEGEREGGRGEGGKKEGREGRGREEGREGRGREEGGRGEGGREEREGERVRKGGVYKRYEQYWST